MQGNFSLSSKIFKTKQFIQENITYLCIFYCRCAQYVAFTTVKEYCFICLSHVQYVQTLQIIEVFKKELGKNA